MMKIVTQKMLVGQGLRGFIGFWAFPGPVPRIYHPLSCPFRGRREICIFLTGGRPLIPRRCALRNDKIQGLFFEQLEDGLSDAVRGMELITIRLAETIFHVFEAGNHLVSRQPIRDNFP
jgi:hypothetical protein